jgi:inosine-uridine nucleoside N-ribohydrolase
MQTKILLDTDIGSDIDDALCLAYLLANPQCDLLGITTVTGEAVKRAQLASVLCKIAGKTIPIVPGVERPLLVPQRQPLAQQAVQLSHWAHDTDFPAHQAICFLRDTIRAHPREITLLTIGPLTNIALLFSMDAEIPSLLKGLVMMCGVFTQGFKEFGTEWNAAVDPHAAAIVYREPVKLHRSVGLDVTSQLTMGAAEASEKLQKHDLLRAVLDFAEVWFKQTNLITLHDPLAAVTLFEESVCQYEKGYVEVAVDHLNPSGRTQWTPQPLTSEHEIAITVDKDCFFKHYFSMFD